MLAAPINALQAFNLNLPIVYQQGFGDASARLVDDPLRPIRPGRLEAAAELHAQLRSALLDSRRTVLHPDLQEGLSAARRLLVGPVGRRQDGDPRRRGHLHRLPQQRGRQRDDRVERRWATRTTSTSCWRRRLRRRGCPRLSRSTSRCWRAASSASAQSRWRTWRWRRSTSTRGRAPRSRCVSASGLNYRNPTTYQTSFGVQRDLGAGLSLELNYLFSRGLHIARNRDINQIGRTGAINQLNP